MSKQDQIKADEPGRVRVQIDFSPAAFSELLQLQQAIDAPTRGDTVRYALRTLQWLTSEIGADGSLVIQKEGGEKTKIMFPFLVNAPIRQEV